MELFVIFSKIETGAASGITRANLGTITVCSKAYCPDIAACET